MTDIDLYEYAYQIVVKSIKKKYPNINKSDLRRMTIEKIRRQLRLHITLEDVDSRDFRNWQVEKRLEWLEDLQMFVYKTLGKKRYLALRGIKIPA